MWHKRAGQRRGQSPTWHGPGSNSSRRAPPSHAAGRAHAGGRGEGGNRGRRVRAHAHAGARGGGACTCTHAPWASSRAALPCPAPPATHTHKHTHTYTPDAHAATAAGGARLCALCHRGAGLAAGVDEPRRRGGAPARRLQRRRPQRAGAAGVCGRAGGWVGRRGGGTRRARGAGPTRARAQSSVALPPSPPHTQPTHTTQGAIVAIEDPVRRIFGLQYHPEVVHSERGRETIRHFLFDVAKARAAGAGGGGCAPASLPRPPASRDCVLGGCAAGSAWGAPASQQARTRTGAQLTPPLTLLLQMSGDWKMENVLEEEMEKIRRQVGGWVRACVGACVCVCVRACVRACASRGCVEGLRSRPPTLPPAPRCVAPTHAPPPVPCRWAPPTTSSARSPGAWTPRSPPPWCTRCVWGGRVGGRVGGWACACLHGWVGGWGGARAGRVGVCVCVGGRLGGGVGERMSGWMAGLVGGWVGGWVGGALCARLWLANRSLPRSTPPTHTYTHPTPPGAWRPPALRVC